MKTTPKVPDEAMLDQAQAAFSQELASTAGQAARASQWYHETMPYLAMSVLVFTFGALLLGTFLLTRSGASALQVIRLIGIVSIVGLSALLLISGYSDSQLTPIIGLFGAISGYLLGKESRPDDTHSSPR